MSTPKLQAEVAPFAELPSLPRGEDGPVFAEPWQAQAFALAEELQSAADRGNPDDGSHYYEHWLAALERLVTSKGLADRAALASRKEEWADAYRHTPHGQPVVLKQGSRAET